MGQKLAHQQAGVAVAAKTVRGSQEVGVPLDKRKPLPFQKLVRAGLHVELHELRLVVEKVLLRRRARHVQVDDGLGLRRRGRLAQGQRRFIQRGSSRRLRFSQEPGKSDGPQANLRLPQEMPARQESQALEPNLFRKRLHTVSL